jgi:hypothetical protein
MHAAAPLEFLQRLTTFVLSIALREEAFTIAGGR